MDKKTNFKDNSNAKAWTGWENNFSNKDKKQDVKIIYSKEINFNTKN